MGVEASNVYTAWRPNTLAGTAGGPIPSVSAGCRNISGIMRGILPASGCASHCSRASRRNAGNPGSCTAVIGAMPWAAGAVSENASSAFNASRIVSARAGTSTTGASSP
jgi:hypothetical protein